MAHQQGAHQQRYGPQRRTLPGGHQRPQPPHAALWMMVAFCACEFRLEAPCVCALAIPIDPTTKIAAAKVMVILRIRSSF
jgi:hypothetical protein